MALLAQPRGTVSESGPFRRPRPQRVRFGGQAGYPGPLGGQGVGVVFVQGVLGAVGGRGVGGVPQWTDLGLGDGQEVLLWLEKPPARNK